jgi:hypothetical protein
MPLFFRKIKTYVCLLIKNISEIWFSVSSEQFKAVCFFRKTVRNSVLILKISSELVCLFLKKNRDLCPSLSYGHLKICVVLFLRTVQTYVCLFTKNSSYVCLSFSFLGTDSKLCPSLSSEQFRNVSLCSLEQFIVISVYFLKRVQIYARLFR